MPDPVRADGASGGSSGPSSEDVLTLEDVTKRFGDVTVVDRLSLTVGKGELFTLLGPSGCGKTTALRIIAGLEQPDEGRILCNQKTVVSVRDGVFVQPEKRRIGLVFQSLALWPHMTVFENVAYPLKIRRLPARSVNERVARILRVVGLEGLDARPAPKLSGGQQQRVALARALVGEPDVLLMDEPFSSLDPGLRRQMSAEIRTLRKSLGLSLIFVTHDQAEAFSISDRLAVMNNGRIEQMGAPRDLYEHPRTAFVRDFLGKTVIVRGSITSLDGSKVSIEIPKAGTIVVSRQSCGAVDVRVGCQVQVSIRPEDLSLEGHAESGESDTLKGMIESVAFAGDRFEAVVRVGEERVSLYLPRHQTAQPGESVWVRFPSDRMSLWPRQEKSESEQRSVS